MPAFQRLASDTRGGIGLIAAGALPLILGFTAFAVDIGSATLESRKLQGIADAAALAAAADPIHAQSLAEAAVAASGWPRAIDVTAVTGDYARDAATGNRFTASSSATDAVRVSLATPSPTYFARAFGQQSIPIARTATAARERFAAFSIGSRLASLDGGILNSYLSALTGSGVSLSLLDYNALASADLDLFGYLGALNTTADLQAASFDDIAEAHVTRAQALDAAAAALDASAPSAATALRKMAGQVSGGSLDLASLIDPGPYAAQSSGGTGVAKVNALALVTAALQIAAPSRQVSLNLGAGVPGLVSTKAIVAIGERPAQSPWIAITDNGMPVIRTAQARIYIDTQLANVSLPGIGSLVGIRLPIFVELASAEARLSGIDCSSAATRGVTVEARPNPAKAAIGVVDTSRLQDFTSPISTSAAHLVNTLLVDVDGHATIDAGAAENWQALRFTSAQIDAGTVQTVASSSPVQGVAASLVHNIALTVKVIGLPIPLTALTQTIGSQLGLVAPALDSLLNLATGAVGVHYGEADVRVTGMRCGTAALVA